MNKYNIGDVVKVNGFLLTIEHVYYSKHNDCYMYTFIYCPFVVFESNIEEVHL